MKNIIAILLVCITFTGFSQSNFRTTALDTVPQLVNVGYTNLSNLNIAYPGTSIVYIKFYDKKTRPYMSVDVPVLTLQVGTSATLSYSLKSFERVAFRNGLWIRCATGITDTARIGVQPGTKPYVEILGY